MSPSVLERLEALNEGATEGPWEMQISAEGGGLYGDRFTFVEGVREIRGEHRWVVRFDDDYGTDPGADAVLIAAARNALPDLLAVAKAAHAVVGAQPSAFRGTRIEKALAPLLREAE
jgi:hypothetical protein